MKRLAPIVLLALLASACSSSKPADSSGASAVIVVNAPFAKAGSVARQIQRGTELAVDEVNRAGGVTVGASKVRLSIKTLDNDLSPSTSASNVRKAVDAGAVAVVDEGTGVDASWRVAATTGLPVGICYQGGIGLVDAVARPNVFRIAPTDRGVSFRLAEYLVPKKLKIAILHDDSAYGTGGAAALDRAFSKNRSSITATIRVPASASDVAPQILQARQSGATALLVWARPPVVALAIRAARTAGWTVPVYASTAGEDPLVRQQLSDHPEWIEGMTFATSRFTAEKGTAPFEKFRAAYEKRFGPDRVGVKSRGKDVIQPPDWAMYSYDFVRIVARAMSIAKTASPGAALLRAMNDADVVGANGDERGFNERTHEGVVDDDVFFARIHDMIFEPVKDDGLSATLPVVPQTL